MKYLNIRWRLAVRTRALDCSSDVPPDVLFLTLCNPTFRAAKLHNFNPFFVLSCFGVTLAVQFLLFAILRTSMS